MALPKPGFSRDTGIAVGRSVGKSPQPPSIEEAIGDAHSRAKKVLGSSPLHYRLVDVFATGTNPISEYRVEIQVTP